MLHNYSHKILLALATALAVASGGTQMPATGPHGLAQADSAMQRLITPTIPADPAGMRTEIITTAPMAFNGSDDGCVRNPFADKHRPRKESQTGEA